MAYIVYTTGQNKKHHFGAVDFKVFYGA